MRLIPSHVSFILKSNGENCIKIRWFLTKLLTKISWLFLWSTVYNNCVTVETFQVTISFHSRHFISPVVLPRSCWNDLLKVILSSYFTSLNCVVSSCRSAYYYSCLMGLNGKLVVNQWRRRTYGRRLDGHPTCTVGRLLTVTWRHVWRDVMLRRRMTSLSACDVFAVQRAPPAVRTSPRLVSSTRDVRPTPPMSWAHLAIYTDNFSLKS